jgi:hypothetical protein
MTIENEDEGILYTMAHSRAKLARLRERSHKLGRKLCGSELHLGDQEAIEMTCAGLQQGIKDMPFDPSEGCVMSAAMKLVAALLVDFANEESEEAGGARLGSIREVLDEELEGLVEYLKEEVGEQGRLKPVMETWGLKSVVELWEDDRALYIGDHDVDGTDIKR